MKQRLKRFYQEQVISHLYEKFKYKNVHQIPRVEKIVVNRGINATRNTNAIAFEKSLLELAIITTQRGVVTRARKAIASFKIREGMAVGMVVNIRSERIYAFLDRLVNLALPRIRDFQGVSPRSFDGHGNYSLGFEEQLIFLEIRYDQIDQLSGIDVSIVTTSQVDNESLALILRIGIPFGNFKNLNIY
jgi:large subunit ribosomal protein L5